MSEVLPVAERILGEQRKLRPFGSTLSVDDRIVQVGGGAEAEFDGAALVAEFQSSFRDGAARGELKATALVYTALSSDAVGAVGAVGMVGASGAFVCVELDHLENYSIVVSFPYRFTDAGELVIDEPFAAQGKHEIFEA